MITQNFINVGILKSSVLILICLCLFLIFLVLVVAISFWKAREKIAKKSLISSSFSANRHYLTGLENRTALLEKIEIIISDTEQEDFSLAVLYIDIDDFKGINESLGIRMGDELLIRMAQRLVERIRSLSKHVFQVGDDEFVVLLEDIATTKDTMPEIASELINELAKPIEISGYILQTTTCIGVCVYPDCANNAEELVVNSSAARYKAKKMGYGSYVIYDDNMSKQNLVRSLISSDIRKALEKNEFVLYYQPKINYKLNKIVGAEALLRWNHPSLGMVAPEVFIPILEDLGLIHNVGAWVLRTACCDFSSLHKTQDPELQIAINLSAHQFNRGDVAGIIAEIIFDTGISPELVELELTETVVMSDTDKSLLMLKVLQSMGIKIAVDDFGTGYSSMNQLTRFPISTLKVDKSFVHDMHLIPEKEIIVSTIIGMAKKLNFEIVAEGVECKEELEILAAHGCDIIQGFYFSKPLSFQQFTEYLTDHRAGFTN